MTTSSVETDSMANHNDNIKNDRYRYDNIPPSNLPKLSNKEPIFYPRKPKHSK